MRFDLTVNILTNLAVHKGVITVFGGTQKRPNVHIEDITDLYVELLETPAELIDGEAFNAGDENHTVAQLAESSFRTVVEDEYPEKAPIKVDNICLQRQPLLPCLLAEDRRKNRMEAEADHRGCRARSLQGLQGRKIPGQHDE